MQDSGMNMYKEIVSIDEFDVSVVEECLGGRLEMEEVMRYLKYAEYFQKNCKSKMEEYVMLVEMERKIDEGVVIEEEEMWEGEDCM